MEAPATRSSASRLFLDLAPGAGEMLLKVTSPPDPLLSIGEFAQQARLTAKALRIYDEIGLLRPVDVDPGSGYRRYSPDQVRTAQLIAMLRGADLSLAEIKSLLEELEGDRSLAAARLDRYLKGLELRHTSRRLLICHIQSVLKGEERPMFLIETRHVPSQRVMSIMRRLRAPETDAFVREAKLAFADHLHGAALAGPFTLIFHGIIDYESDGPLEAVLPCPDQVQPSEIVGIRTEPAHDEAFTTITKAEWAYPAILAAYDAVSCSPESLGRPRSRLSCREVYLAEPDAIGDDEMICDIAFPLG